MVACRHSRSSSGVPNNGPEFGAIGDPYDVAVVSSFGDGCSFGDDKFQCPPTIGGTVSSDLLLSQRL